MRAVVQRVSRAAVRVGDAEVGAVGRGLLVLLGVAAGDGAPDAAWLAEKVVGLRVFPDAAGAMNVPLLEAGGALLVVSQFTLLGDCRRGRRPSFVEAAPPAVAEALYLEFVARARALGATVATGAFRTHMDVQLVNDGPVTLLLDSTRAF